MRRLSIHFLQTFGRLHVLREVRRIRQDTRRFQCICDCGTVKEVPLRDLRYRPTISCGCNGSRATIGARSMVHGGYKSSLFALRSRMLGRCYNPKNKKYRIYGGRGITVCDRWRNSYADFRDDILREIGSRPGLHHSIDRWPDNNGNYEPGNIRWATEKQQGRNQRRNIWINRKGERKLLIEVCEETGTPYMTAYYRLRVYGYPEDSIFD